MAWQAWGAARALTGQPVLPPLPLKTTASLLLEHALALWPMHNYFLTFTP